MRDEATGEVNGSYGARVAGALALLLLALSSAQAVQASGPLEFGVLVAYEDPYLPSFRGGVMSGGSIVAATVYEEGGSQFLGLVSVGFDGSEEWRLDIPLDYATASVVGVQAVEEGVAVVVHGLRLLSGGLSVYLVSPEGRLLGGEELAELPARFVASESVIAPDGSLYVAGSEYVDGSWQFAVARVSGGEVVWSRAWGGRGHDFATRLTMTPQGYLAVSGVSLGDGLNSSSVAILSQSGALLWSQEVRSVRVADSDSDSRDAVYISGSAAGAPVLGRVMEGRLDLVALNYTGAATAIDVEEGLVAVYLYPGEGSPEPPIIAIYRAEGLELADGARLEALRGLRASSIAVDLERGLIAILGEREGRGSIALVYMEVERPGPPRGVLERLSTPAITAALVALIALIAAYGRWGRATARQALRGRPRAGE